MTKLQFLLALHGRLSALPQAEVEERLNFYSEMIEDRMEEGLSEEEAVAAVGDVDTVAAHIAAERIPEAPPKRRSRRLRWWEIVLLAVGSPLWLSLGVAAAAVALALYIVLWSVVVALWSVGASLAGGALGGAMLGTALLAGGRVAAGLALIGAGFVCAGLAVLLLFGCIAATKGAAWLTKAPFCRGRRAQHA